MNREKVLKILGVCATTALLTGLIAFCLVKTVDKGIRALGGVEASNYIEKDDKLIGVFITSGAQEVNESQEKINKAGKVYGNISLGESNRIQFSELTGEVFAAKTGIFNGAGKYGKVNVSNPIDGKENIYNDNSEVEKTIDKTTYNMSLEANKNSINNQVTLYVNPLFENKDGKVFVTNKKCEKIVYDVAQGAAGTYNVIIDTKRYGQYNIKKMISIKVNINFVVPEIDPGNKQLFI